MNIIKWLRLEWFIIERSVLKNINSKKKVCTKIFLQDREFKTQWKKIDEFDIELRFVFKYIPILWTILFGTTNSSWKSGLFEHEPLIWSRIILKSINQIHMKPILIFIIDENLRFFFRFWNSKVFKFFRKYFKNKFFELLTL